MSLRERLDHYLLENNWRAPHSVEEWLSQAVPHLHVDCFLYAVEWATWWPPGRQLKMAVRPSGFGWVCLWCRVYATGQPSRQAAESSGCQHADSHGDFMVVGYDHGIGRGTDWIEGYGGVRR
jgi:hypothetical protein